ncbi:MAG TPA: aminodeoxychorismate/anthranilate synthase component II [Firmicutes bacterium]|nr:aminodeoxychorismate/anthranilate synthase component II [Bacillota bacterium]
MKKILLIDNYDSFTYILLHLLQSVFRGTIDVIRNDAWTEEELMRRAYDAYVISPGPKSPGEAGLSNAVIRLFYKEKPILGVCLGMQCINEVFGGKTVRSSNPVHGKTSSVEIHKRKTLFRKVSSPFQAARYHSLECGVTSPELEVTSSFQGIPMSLEHVLLPVMGVQFHPESFMTQAGKRIIDNFMRCV